MGASAADQASRKGVPGTRGGCLRGRGGAVRGRPGGGAGAYQVLGVLDEARREQGGRAVGGGGRRARDRQGGGRGRPGVRACATRLRHAGQLARDGGEVVGVGGVCARVHADEDDGERDADGAVLGEAGNKGGDGLGTKRRELALNA